MASQTIPTDDDAPSGTSTPGPVTAQDRHQNTVHGNELSGYPAQYYTQYPDHHAENVGADPTLVATPIYNFPNAIDPNDYDAAQIRFNGEEPYYPAAQGNRTDEKTAYVSGTPAELHPRSTIPGWVWTAMLVGNSLFGFVSGYDVSNVANTQVSIYRAFGRIDLLPWVNLTYSLATVAMVPLARRLTAVFNLKHLMIGSCGFIIVGAALCGAAPSSQSIVVGRVFIAVGLSISYQTALTFIVIFAYPHEVAMANSIITGPFALGLFVGPILGGAFSESQSATWRWAFYIILPLVGILMMLSCFVFPSHWVNPNLSIFQALNETDWVGCSLHIFVFVLLGLVCILPGPTWDFSSGPTIAVYVLFGLVLVAYILQQTFSVFTTQERRVLPIQVLRYRVVAFTSICAVCASFAYGVGLYYTPIYFAFTRGTEPVAASLRLLPFVGSMIVSIVLSGAMLPRVRYYMAIYILGGILMLLGAGLLQTINRTSTESRIMGFEVLLGAGLGLIWPLQLAVGNVLLPASARLDLPVVYNLAQYGGVSLSLCVAGAVFSNVGFDFVKTAILEFGIDYPDGELRNLLAGVDSGLLAEAGANNAIVVEAVLDAITNTILRVLYLPLAAGILCLISACLLKLEAPDFTTVHKDSNTDQGRSYAVAE